MRTGAEVHGRCIVFVSCAICVALIAAGCGVAGNRKLHISDIVPPKGRNAIKELAAANRSRFDRPYTLLILVDENATCGMAEAAWWREWEQLMHHRGFGFVLATSREDSIDLAIAAEMDSVQAPTLVVPSCKRFLAELRIRPGFNPLNLLLDSTDAIRYLWSPRLDTTPSRALMNIIDSLTTPPLPSGD